jgi:hypothetical protein
MFFGRQKNEQTNNQIVTTSLPPLISNTNQFIMTNSTLKNNLYPGRMANTKHHSISGLPPRYEDLSLPRTKAIPVNKVS